MIRGRDIKTVLNHIKSALDRHANFYMNRQTDV